MPAPEFLELMFKILSEDPEAKKEMQAIIDEIAEEINKYELGAAGIDTNDDEEDLGLSAPATEPEEADYASMAKRDIEKLIDQALDARDFDRVRELSKYINESKQKELFERVHNEIGYPG
jgi:transcription termination factor NusB